MLDTWSSYTLQKPRKRTQPCWTDCLTHKFLTDITSVTSFFLAMALPRLPDRNFFCILGQGFQTRKPSVGGIHGYNYLMEQHMCDLSHENVH